MFGAWGYRVCGAIALLLCTTCNPLSLLDLCDPDQGERVGFYSSGDCLGLDARPFRGHEWLTFLANEDVDEDLQFTPEQLDLIIEANRRVDFPKELLVHLDNGPLAYIEQLDRYHSEPENQRRHFLLTRVNSTEEASADSLAWMRNLLQSAVAEWNYEGTSSLTHLGQATHTLQDSFSPAHADRTRDEDGWCILAVRAAIGRDEGFKDVPRHDRHDEGARPGHMTALDAILIESERCLSPKEPEEVRACLTLTAQRATLATRDFLAMARELMTTSALPEAVDEQFDAFVAAHLALCSEP